MDTDTELMIRARAEDREAFGLLFVRHREVAVRVARRLSARNDVDDVVAEAFARVLAQVADGRGPLTSFRAYLLTAVRHEAARRRVVARRWDLLADLDPVADVVGVDEVDDAVRAACRSLPPRWREVLWQLEVEGRRPHEIAGELGLTPNAVSALGHRARAGLRAAYLARSQAA